MSCRPANVSWVVGHGLLFAAQADGLTNKQARDDIVRNPGAGFEGVAVGKCLDAMRLGQAETLPHQSVDVRLGAAP